VSDTKYRHQMQHHLLNDLVNAVLQCITIWFQFSGFVAERGFIMVQ